jgi:hypothetical protein
MGLAHHSRSALRWFGGHLIHFGYENTLLVWNVGAS